MQKIQNSRDTYNKTKILKIILKKLYLVIIVAAMFAGTCFVCCTYLIKPDCESSLTVYVTEQDTTSSGNTNIQSSNEQIISLNAFKTIVKSKKVIEEIINQTEVVNTYAEIYEMISVMSNEDDNMFRIAIKCKDSELALSINEQLQKILPTSLNEYLPGKTLSVIDTDLVGNIYTNRTLYTIISGSIGFVVMAIAVVYIALSDKTIKNENDLNELSKLPVMGIIPDLFDGGGKRKETKLDRNSYFIDRYSYNLDGIDKNQKKHNDRNDRNVIGENLGYDAIEAYKHLRTNIEFALSKPRNDGCKVIGITSSVRGEGKSIVASNLAWSLVENKKKVLLIDADLRSPSLNDKLRVHNKAGLVDCLEGNINPVDAIYNYDDDNPNLQLILGDSSIKNASELLNSDNMRNLIEGLRDGYDFIIIDLPSVNIVADALTISDIIDSYLIVVRSDYSLKNEVADCIKSIVYFETNILGFVLTDVNDGRIYYNPKPGYRKTNTTNKRSALFYTSEPPKKKQGTLVIEKEYSEAYKKADEILKKFENKEDEETVVNNAISEVFDEKIEDDELDVLDNIEQVEKDEGDN